MKGKREGHGKRTNHDGSFYEGDYKNDNPHGKGIYRWSDTEIYEG